MSKYIGRGEVISSLVLERLFVMPIVTEQVPIQSVISPEEFNTLDPIYQNHKFDLRLDLIANLENLDEKLKIKRLMLEVNYKHGEGAAKKWSNVFAPLLVKNGFTPVTIDDYDCRKKGIFYLNSKKQHVLSWDDFRDVIDALEKAGVTP